MPWPFGLVLGVVAFLAIRYGIGWYFSTAGGPALKGTGELALGGAFTPLAWIVLAMCWVAALASYLKQHQRKVLLDAQSGLDSLRNISWREFEMLVGEAYRRQGYRVEEQGLGGADGGIDLILFKDGQTILVQCKQWRARQISVSTVREMWGLLAHHSADGVKIVCANAFTRDAAAFAEGKPIELVSGQALVSLIQSGQEAPRSARSRIAPKLEAEAIPRCPRCSKAMVRRTNRADGKVFWGCSDYPRCKGTRPAHA
ncbi:restriction endonuclease [Marilutibacter aestuarii]